MNKNILLQINKIEYFIACAIIISFHLPLIILGQNGYIMIDDVLNLEFLYKHLLKINGLLFELNPNFVIPNIYSDGLSLGYIHSRFNIIDLLFYFFNSFDAYIINSILIKLIGFFNEIINKPELFFYWDSKYFSYFNFFLINTSKFYIRTYSYRNTFNFCSIF